MPNSESVLIQCNRRGPVTAGPLTLKPGINEVSEEDLIAFKATRTGQGAFAKGLVERVVYTPEKFEDPEPIAKPSPIGFLGKGGDGDDGPGDEPVDTAPSAPTLALSAKDAIAFIENVTDEDVLEACYEADERVTVRKACVVRAEELEEAADLAEESDEEEG